MNMTPSTVDTLDRSSRNRLNGKDLHKFGGDTLFDAIARAVCHAGCLPRKELWLDGPLAMDAARVSRLHSQGYRVLTQMIPEDITPKNRLLMAEPELDRKNISWNRVLHI